MEPEAVTHLPLVGLPRSEFKDLYLLSETLIACEVKFFTFHKILHALVIFQV
jgi:hypothetical protein